MHDRESEREKEKIRGENAEYISLKNKKKGNDNGTEVLNVRINNLNVLILRKSENFQNFWSHQPHFSSSVN